MPYVSHRVEDVNEIVLYWPSFEPLVKKALEAGQKVEINSSGFSDPGPDWNELMIDGKVVPGSRTDGY